MPKQLMYQQNRCNWLGMVMGGAVMAGVIMVGDVDLDMVELALRRSVGVVTDQVGVIDQVGMDQAIASSIQVLSMAAKNAALLTGGID